ncbi:hypothetical protein [Nonlabens marinus]|uniref:Lipoprotein n=1 Tax=Nonlabens marinus S1-08 TaxID=1454201 RepID=W8VXY1_9FLAO|nr:hypothetical protein [Nonlabens marinus]BAO56717.1 hypothetical protein NMS_2708 [Nonlabens marinus S1-08]
MLHKSNSSLKIKTLLLCFTGFLLLTSCKKPEDKNGKAIELTGTLTQWDQGAASVNGMGFFVEPHIIGYINPNGELSIQLPDHFLKMTQDAFAKANSQEGAPYEMMIPTARESFQQTEGLSFQGAEVPLALAGKYYGFEVLQNDAASTAIFAASSEAFMQHLLYPSQHQAVEGWLYYFLYAEKPVRLNGTSAVENLFSNDNEDSYSSSITYQVDIQQGWNIVKYEVKEIVQSPDAKYNADSKVIISTVDALPTGLEWISISSLNLNL